MPCSTVSSDAVALGLVTAVQSRCRGWGGLARSCGIWVRWYLIWYWLPDLYAAGRGRPAGAADPGASVREPTAALGHHSAASGADRCSGCLAALFLSVIFKYADARHSLLSGAVSGVSSAVLLPIAARSLSGCSGCVDAGEEGRTQLTQAFRREAVDAHRAGAAPVNNKDLLPPAAQDLDADEFAEAVLLWPGRTVARAQALDKQQPRISENHVTVAALNPSEPHLGWLLAPAQFHAQLCQGVGHRRALWRPEQHAQEAGAALRRPRMIEAVPAVAALPGCRENQFSAVRACLRRPLVDGCASLRFLLPGWSFNW